MEALSVKGLCKEYPSFSLKDVSFSVEQGAIMGFIGRNGAGKTTTLKSILNLVHPSRGEIRFFGTELKKNELEIKKQIGFVSGGVDYYVKKKIKTITNVTRRFYDDWDEQAYRRYMAQFELDENKTPEQLSAGMKVKYALTLALSHRAKLLILDEPTSGLDPVSRDDLLDVFLSLQREGVSILFSTHITSDLDRCADSITYIRRGEIAASMPLEQFLNERVFGPIGMTRTVLDIDGSEARKIASDGNITSLFEEVNGQSVADDCWSILPPFRACACVKSTAHDMARYYSCLGNGGVIDGVQAIPAKAVEIMVGNRFGEEEKPIYCYGLYKRTKNGHVICEHSGGLHGVSTHGGFLKGEGYGFAALCNQGDCDTEDLCWMMYNMMMGDPIENSHRWLHPVGYDFGAPETIVGSYICHEGIPSTLKVYINDEGKLIGETAMGPMDMVYCGETWFQGLRNGDVANRMRFYIRDNKAWSVMVGSRVWERIEE